jgi:hypothetical protein
MSDTGNFAGKEFEIVINTKAMEGVIPKLQITGNVKDTIKFTIGVYTDVENPSAGEEFYFYATYIGLSKTIHNNANTLNTTRLKFFRHSRYLKKNTRVVTVENLTPILKNYPYDYPLEYSSNDNSIPNSIFEVRKSDKSVHEAFIDLQVYGGYNGFKVGVGGYLSDTQKNGYECTRNLTSLTNAVVTLNSFTPTKKVELKNGYTITDISEERPYQYSTYFTIEKPVEFLYFNNMAKAVITLIEQFDEV